MPEEQEPVRRLDSNGFGPLIERAGVRRPCDLDLIVFFGRHPRSLLSSESLAAFLGYDIKQIAESLDDLLASGVLRRRQTKAHASRLYELILDRPSMPDWLGELLAQASTRPGRMALLDEIARRSQPQSDEAGNNRSAATSGPRRMTMPQRTSIATEKG